VAQKNEHLTTEQLSAFLDGEVSAQERTQWDMHLKTCQQCQRELASLRQTVALLRALPQPALPRSFVLSADVAGPIAPPALAGTRRTPTPIRPAEQPRQRTPYLRVAFRTLSAIAAVIGIVFFLSGILPTLSHGGGTATGFSSSRPPAASQSSNGQAQGTPSNGNSTPQAVTAAVSGGITPTPATTRPSDASGHSGNSQAQQPAPAEWPTILIFNLSTPEGRLGFGIILFILGIMGYVLFKRRRQRAP
jgi:anti-sigma factor RsiW